LVDILEKVIVNKPLGADAGREAVFVVGMEAGAARG
jgi:hypothetical protein